MRKTKKVLIILTTILVFCIILDYLPLFNLVLINPPPGEYTTGKWDRLTYSSLIIGDNQILPAIRTFIVRRESDISFSPGNGEHWSNIADHFRKQLVENGWVEAGYSGNCLFYFPEATFSTYGENGYLVFMKGPYKEELSDLNSLLCLGVYKIGNEETSYHIVFQTTELSIFSRLVQLID